MLLLSAWQCAMPAWAAKPFVAEYRASVMGGVSADARMSLSSNGGDRWTYALDIDSPVATLRQATVFEERNGAWRPLSGQDSSQFLMKKSQKNATYDWGKGEARWSEPMPPLRWTRRRRRSRRWRARRSAPRRCATRWLARSATTGVSSWRRPIG